MRNIVEYKHVSKGYNNVKVLKDFNFEIEEGEFVSVIGTSGSGKTTMMKMINGLILPDEGEVFVHGEKICPEKLKELRRKTGYVIQGNGLFPHMTVAENIGYVLKLEKVKQSAIDETVERNLQLVHLPSDCKNRFPSELSGGQQQRVGIARAYANHPDLLLMDEPFGAVDAITRYQLQKDIKEIHRITNCTIVFITHDLNEALKLSTKILVMDQGEIQQIGTPKEIIDHPRTDFVKRLVELSR